MLMLTMVALLCSFASAAKDQCDTQTCDATSLLQSKVSVSPGQERSQEVSGSLVLSRSTASEDHCDIQGTFTHADGNATFRIGDKSFELLIGGLPGLAYKVGETTIGKAASRKDSPMSEEYKRGAELILRSAFAAKGARKLSHLLHLKGFNGGEAPCAFPFHMFMVSLTEGSSQAPPIGTEDKPWLADLDDASSEADRDLSESPCPVGGCIPPNMYDPYTHALKGDMHKCPYKKKRTWNCRINSGDYVKDDSAYAFRTDTDTGKTLGSKIDPLGPAPLWHDPLGSNVQCSQADFPNEPHGCVGLCGAGCDCWESLCGTGYRCNYNPWCCAHDYACDGYWDKLATTCIESATVMAKCQDAEKHHDGR